MDIIKLRPDYNGYLWCWDSKEERIFCEGDTTPREERGYPCNSLQEAHLMLLNQLVP